MHVQTTSTLEVASLNREFLGFLAKFPPAAAEAIDFFYKSEYDNFVATFQRRERESIAIVARSESELESLLRRFLLLADLVIFNVATYMPEPQPMVLPLPDELASPVLAVNSVMDPASHKQRFPTPAEMLLVIAGMHGMGKAGDSASDFLGFEWGRTGYEWRRTTYTRTSTPFKNAVNENCHIAVGAGLPYPKSTCDWLTTEASPLLESGMLAFAPFLRVPPGSWGDSESIYKAHFIHANVGATRISPLDRNRLQALAELEIPFIDGIPLPLLAEVLKDEREALVPFRAAISRLLRSVEKIASEAEMMREVEIIRRDQIDPELAKLAGLAQRLSNMRSIRTAGCVLASTAICLLAAIGLPPASLLFPAAGAIGANLYELARRIEEEQKLRDSPMYFLWQLKRSST
jgi:hypothetical protein